MRMSIGRYTLVALWFTSAACSGNGMPDAARSDATAQDAAVVDSTVQDVATTDGPPAPEAGAGDAAVDQGPDTSSTDAPSDAGSDVVQADTAIADGGSCSSLSQMGSLITETFDPGPIPSMTGGAIVDGTYVQVSRVRYNRSSGTPGSRRSSLYISGSRWDVITEVTGSMPGRTTLTATAGPGSALRLVIACPPLGLMFSQSYTVSGNQLRIVEPSTQSVDTFMRL